MNISGSVKPKGRIPCVLPPPSSPGAPESRTEITSGLGAIPVVIVIVAIILTGIGTVWYLYKNNDKFYNFVSYTFGIEDSSRGPLRYQNVEQGQSLAEHMDDGSENDDQM